MDRGLVIAMASVTDDLAAQRAGCSVLAREAEKGEAEAAAKREAAFAAARQDTKAQLAQQQEAQRLAQAWHGHRLDSLRRRRRAQLLVCTCVCVGGSTKAAGGGPHLFH